MTNGRDLLGTRGVLQDAGNTSANDIWQRSTEAGHRDASCGANPREGVRWDQRREHGSPFSPRCTELALTYGARRMKSVLFTTGHSLVLGDVEGAVGGGNRQ